MDIFKEASQQKLRFNTSKGQLSTENLWDLSIAELDKLALTLEKEYDNSAPSSFLKKRSPKDRTAKLSFDVVVDILNTKVALDDAAKDARETKEFNDRIISLIAEKQDEELKGKSIADLKKMLKKL